MKTSFSDRNRRLAFEVLEDKRMLATINWVNGNDLNANFFNLVYEDKADLAAAVVRRAISDWEAVIESFNYAADGDPNR